MSYSPRFNNFIFYHSFSLIFKLNILEIISGKYNFIVRVDDKELQHLEIWNTKRLLSKLNVTEMHGLVYNDRWVEGVSWSKNEKQIFYIAEQKKEKKLSHFDIKKENELLNKGNEFEYNEDWGEKYVNFSNPRIFNLSLVDGDDRMELNVKEVEGIPPTLSCGQVTISPLNDKEIVFTGIVTHKYFSFCYT